MKMFAFPIWGHPLCSSSALAFPPWVSCRRVTWRNFSSRASWAPCSAVCNAWAAPWTAARGPGGPGLGPGVHRRLGRTMEKYGKNDEHWMKHWVKQWLEAVNPMVVVESSSHLYLYIYIYIYHCIMLTFTTTDEHGWKWWRLDTFGTLTPEVTADSPSVAADYGDRAILYKPEGWEARDKVCASENWCMSKSNGHQYVENV